MTFETALLAVALSWPTSGNLEGLRGTVESAVAAGSRPAASAAVVIEYERTGHWTAGASRAVARAVTQAVDHGVKVCRLGILGGVSWAMGRGCAPSALDAWIAGRAWTAYGEAKRMAMRSGTAAAPSAPRAKIDQTVKAYRPERLTIGRPKVDNRRRGHCPLVTDTRRKRTRRAPTIGIHCDLVHGCRTWGLK